VSAAGPDPARGVFETVLVNGGRVQALDAHLGRLTASARALYDTALPPDLPAAVHERAAGLDGPHRLRIDAVPAAHELTIAVAASPLDPDRPRRYRCVATTIPGGHGPHKYVDRDRLTGTGTGTGTGTTAVPLIVDTNGDVLEAAWANVFVLTGDELATPPADGRLLPGVTRARLLARAPALGLHPVERPISIEEVRATPILILTSSLALAARAAVDREPTPDPDDRRLDALRAALDADDWR
jgi:para-aminobenzoate synthetase/4-amino-4-deoxychorismate lyase